MAVSSAWVGEVRGDARAVTITELGVGLVDDQGWVVYERAGAGSRTDGDFAALAWDGGRWLTCGSDGLVSWHDGDATVLEATPCDAVVPHRVGGIGLAIRTDGAFATWRGRLWDDPAGEADALVADRWLAAAAGASLTVWGERARATYTFEAPLDALGVAGGGPLWSSAGLIGSTTSLETWAAPDDVTALVSADLAGVGDPAPFAVAGGQLWAVADGVALGAADVVAVGDVDGDGCDEIITAAGGALRQWFDPSCDAPVDGDHDGYTAFAGDCDDADPALSPAAVDTCDGIDNDCDGEVDDAGDFLGGPTTTRASEGEPFSYKVRWSGCTPVGAPKLAVPDGVVCGRYQNSAFACAVRDGGVGTLALSQRLRDGTERRVLTPFEGIEVAPVLEEIETSLTFVTGFGGWIEFEWSDPGLDTVTLTTDTPWVIAPGVIEPDSSHMTASLRVKPPEIGQFPVTVTFVSEGVPTTFPLEILVRAESRHRIFGEPSSGCGPRSPVDGLAVLAAVAALRRSKGPRRPR